MSVCFLKYRNTTEDDHSYSVVVPLPFSDPVEARSFLESEISRLGKEWNTWNDRSKAAWAVYKAVSPVGAASMSLEMYQQAERKKLDIMETVLAKDGFGHCVTLDDLSILTAEGFGLSPVEIVSEADYLKHCVVFPLIAEPCPDF